MLVCLICWLSSNEAMAGALIGALAQARVMTQYAYDSNITRSEEKPLSDRIYIVSPSLHLGMRHKQHSLNLTYNAQLARYEEYFSENYNSHSANALLNISNYKGFRYVGQLQYSQSKEERGAPNTSVQSLDEPVRLQRYSGGTRITYERSKFGGALYLDLSLRGVSFDNIEEKYRNSDNGVLELGGDFLLTGKTSGILKFSASTTRFRFEEARQGDSTIFVYAGGLSWKTTGKTTSQALLGYNSKQYRNSGGQMFGTVFGNVSINWKRKSFSKGNIKLDHSIVNNTPANTQNVVDTGLSASYNHRFSKRFSSSIQTSTSMIQYQGDRTDRYQRALFQASYKLFPKITTDYAIEWVARDSKSPGLSNNAMIFRISIDAVVF